MDNCKDRTVATNFKVITSETMPGFGRVNEQLSDARIKIGAVELRTTGGVGIMCCEFTSPSGRLLDDVEEDEEEVEKVKNKNQKALDAKAKADDRKSEKAPKDAVDGDSDAEGGRLLGHQEDKPKENESKAPAEKPGDDKGKKYGLNDDKPVKDHQGEGHEEDDADEVPDEGRLLKADEEKVKDEKSKGPAEHAEKK